MKRTKSFKLLLVIITAIAALFVCSFALATKEQNNVAEADTTLPLLEEVTATMPKTMSNTDTSTFDVSLAIDYVAGSKCNQITFKFGYDVSKVEYVSYRYDDMYSAVGADPADATALGAGWKSISITSGGIAERHNVKMMTFTFRLKSGLQGGDKVVFQFDSFKSPIFYNNKQVTPKVADGTLVLPTLEMLVTA